MLIQFAPTDYGMARFIVDRLRHRGAAATGPRRLWRMMRKAERGAYRTTRKERNAKRRLRAWVQFVCEKYVAGVVQEQKA